MEIKFDFSPHNSTSSSELSPQSSSPSHTQECSLQRVLLQRNSSGRQKNAPVITTVCQFLYHGRYEYYFHYVLDYT